MPSERAGAPKAIRIPFEGDVSRRHRTLDERILVRFPGLARRLLGAWAQLPLESRLRRQLLVRGMRQGYAALNRRDFGFVRTRFHPDLVYYPRSDEPDPSPHLGLEAYERLLRGFVDAFSEVTIEVLDLIDAGGT